MMKKICTALIPLILKSGCSLATDSIACIMPSQEQEMLAASTKVYTSEVRVNLIKLSNDANLLMHSLADYRSELINILAHPLEENIETMAALKSTFQLFDRFHELRCTRYLKLLTDYKILVTEAVELSTAHIATLPLNEVMNIFSVCEQLQSIFDIIQMDHTRVIERSRTAYNLVTRYPIL